MLAERGVGNEPATIPMRVQNLQNSLERLPKPGMFELPRVTPQMQQASRIEKTLHDGISGSGQVRAIDMMEIRFQIAPAPAFQRIFQVSGRTVGIDLERRRKHHQAAV